MKTTTTDNEVAPNGTLVIGLDARGVVAGVFPVFSLGTWRRMDSAGKVPRGFRVGGRKLWRLADLRRWADAGFPDRREFDARALEKK